MKPLALTRPRLWPELPAWSRRAAIALMALALLVLLVIAVAYRALWVRYDGGLDQLQSRIQRLDGIVQNGSEIEQRLTTAQREVKPWLHPGGDNAQNAVSQLLRELVVASGSTLVSSQVAPAPGEDGKAPRVRISATIGGDWPQLMAVAEALQSRLPPLWVRSVNVMREGGTGPRQPQNARLVLQLDAPVSASTQGTAK